MITTNSKEVNATETMIKMVLDRWQALIKNFDTLLDLISDDQLQKEVSPGKNRGIYLLGHLAAVHDDMLPLLNFGEKLYPSLSEPFIKSPDKAVSELPSAEELRVSWNKVNDVLAEKFARLKPDEWFQKHNAVSTEDFIKEPHRNRLNIIITRTTHLSYHLGQFILLK